VHNARLRASINGLGQPFLTEVVIAAPNREYLAALVFPNLPALRGRFADTSANTMEDDAAFLRSDEVRAFFQETFARHNQEYPSSSGRIERALLLAVPPQLDANETTDKGYINQIAVLRNRADLVERLYMEPAPSEVILATVSMETSDVEEASGEQLAQTPSGDSPAPSVVVSAPGARRRKWWPFGK
jgi:feruloyl-CoA synthase